MRRRHQLSIALNAILLAALALEWRSGRPPAAPASAARARSAPASTPAAAPPRPVRIGEGWQGWIGPLRAAQVPPAVLAGLVQADFDRRWQARQAEIQARYMRGEIDADGLAAAGVQREIERDRELRAALGAEGYRAWDMDRVLGGLHVGSAQLSEQERGQVYDLERGLQDELRQDQEDKLRGTIDGATAQSRQAAAQDKVAQELRGLLGEQRAGLLQGADDALGNVKRTLGADSLSEAQLESLAAGQRQWDQARSALVAEQVATQDPALARSIQAGEEAWRDQFAAIAGPQALDDYLKLQDSRYLDLRRNAPRWGLAPSSVEGIFAAIQDQDDVLAAYRWDAASRGVDPAIVAGAEKGFTLKTDDALRAELGAAAVDRLEANGILPTR